MPHVQQSIFYEKFIRYMEFDRGAPFSDDERSEILERFSKGLCHGFSVTHSYMAATDNLEWWKKLLEIMSGWEKWDEKSLADRVVLPGSRSKEENGETLKSLFGRAINYVLYNHGSEISGLAQWDLLKKGNFTSEKGDIIRHATISGSMRKAVLEKILKPEFFNQEAIYLMHSTDHACSIRFHKNNWYFYNPSFSEGEKCFTNLLDLQKEIGSSLGRIVSIEIASWNPKLDLSEFIAVRQAMLENDDLGLTTDPAPSVVFFEMLRSAPDQFSALISLAEQQEKSRIYLANLLGVIDVGDKTNNLQSIIKFAPDEFSRIITLAAKHADLYQSMVAALGNRSIFQWTSFNLITKYSPRSLEKIIAFAETDESIKKIIAVSLSNKIKTGETGLELIAKFAPEHLGKIITLAKIDENIRHSLINALKEKSTENAEVLNKIKQFAPDERAWIEMQVNDLRELEILKRNIRISIDGFARKSPWCMDYSNKAMFKSPSEGGKIVRALMEKISGSKNAAEIQKHLENSKVRDGEPTYNQCLENCIQNIAGQHQAKQTPST